MVRAGRLFNLGKRRLRRGSKNISLIYLKGEWKERGRQVFSVVPSDRTRGNRCRKKPQEVSSKHKESLFFLFLHH